MLLFANATWVALEKFSCTHIRGISEMARSFLALEGINLWGIPLSLTMMGVQGFERSPYDLPICKNVNHWIERGAI